MAAGKFHCERSIAFNFFQRPDAKQVKIIVHHDLLSDPGIYMQHGLGQTERSLLKVKL